MRGHTWRHGSEKKNTRGLKMFSILKIGGSVDLVGDRE